MSPPPSYRTRQTQGVVPDIDVPLMCMTDAAFVSQTQLRRWINTTASLAHITSLVGRRLTLRTVIVAGSKVAGRRSDGRKSGWSRFFLDGMLAQAGSTECERFIEQIDTYGNLDGAAVLAPGFSSNARRLIEEHTATNLQLPVFAIQYTCLRAPGSQSIGVSMNLVAGHTGLALRSAGATEGARQEFWCEIAEALQQRGITNYNLAMSRTQSLSIPIRIHRYSSVDVRVFTRFRRLAVGVFIPTTGPHGADNAAALGRPGCLSLPGREAPRYKKRARHEAHYFILAPLAGVGVRPPIAADEVADMLIQLKRQTEQALGI